MMKAPLIRTRTCLAALALLAATGAQATDSNLKTTVNSVLIYSDATFGGCMAALAISPTTKLPGCGASWVTFDCANALGTTDTVRAYRMLDQAQLAYALKKNVYVAFTDSQKVNGYCFAKRIDLTP
jgi:hypothetical protein